MSQTLSPRWDTPFGRWVHETGVSRIVAALGRDPDLRVTTNAVYEWVAGRNAPTTDRGIALVRMSGGRLTLDAVYQHRHQVSTHAGQAGGHSSPREGARQR